MTQGSIDRHCEEYLAGGLTVLRGLVPPPLIADLRREAAVAAEIARGRSGPQAQRLQPVWSYDGFDHGPFREFLDLPELRAVVAATLSPDHRPSDRMALFIEPQRDAWCGAWHRDWGNVPGVDLAEFFRTAADPRMYNQLNAPLYDDHSLWVVPGSDRRADTPQERAAFAAYPPEGPDLRDGMTAPEREAESLRYARRMPGGAPLLLHAGDVAFYRACIWHLGCYLPYVRRATLHDSFLCDADRDWQASVRRIQQAARTA
ncbi:MAG TPA: hypothetical protein VKT77_14895 [Chthonomonadaceae bacterium]|nr:hypothetical protein [Chthonomonadaceae bacterium]